MSSREQMGRRLVGILRAAGLRADVDDLTEAILDAVLPQVSTVEELEALPVGTVVASGTGMPYKRFKYGWQAAGSQREFRTEDLPDPPLIVVWRPAS